MTKKQLVHIIKHEFEIWDYYSHINAELNTRSAKDIPFIRWPDRIPCIEANLFMLSQFNLMLSRRVKGGTLRTYAYNISNLLRFCFLNQINLTDLTDNRFWLFINGLQTEKGKLGVRVRSNDQVIKIGRTCINFLRFIAGFHSLTNFIGQEDFNAIKVNQKENKIILEGSRKPIIKFYWQHNSFPTPDNKTKRHPISDSAVKAIKSVIKSHTDPKLVKRNLCLFQTYEQTGGRRTEITLLKVNDVREAYNSGLKCPMLRLQTLKRKDQNTMRLVPVPRVFVDNLMDYISTNRQRIIRTTLGKINDHGYVFISHTTGKPLTPDTVSTYMINWRADAGIEDAAFVHLIRHAYITEKLKCIILEHEIENIDQFRRSLLNTERFKMQLREWTGHTNLSSLDPYIDLAFADLAGVRKTYNAVTLKSAVEVVKDRLDLVRLNIKSGNMTTTEAFNDFDKIVDAFEVDINHSLN